MVSELRTNVHMTSSSTISPISTPSQLSFLSQISLPNYNFPVKLESDNYFFWKSQILPTIVGCNMDVLVIGELIAPSKTILENVGGSTTETWSVTNPDFLLWHCLDQAWWDGCRHLLIRKFLPRLTKSPHHWLLISYGRHWKSYLESNFVLRWCN